MDEQTGGVALIAAATFIAYSVVGSSVIESGTGRRVPLLVRLGLPQAPKMRVWWAMLWLAVVMLIVGTIQLAMLSAVIGPERAPLTRLVGAVEMGALGVWGILIIRFVRNGPNRGNRSP